ncbi:unnamed protein product [Ceutorhynchus assimilis]|uniref:DUF6589 domain-containing protein n=1 Tax=Ceutorhynchus assimilis TaxID=467358 RepID=A0A9N9MKM7_9CUCU|nr:unnamed protein product [Ceutorhynchus assimilis]
MYGSSEPTECGASAPLITVCQLVVTNMKASMPHGNIVRHVLSTEASLVMYNGLAAYGRSRDKHFVQEMHETGISVSPNRVTAVTSQLCRMVVKRALEEKVVCPSNLRKDLFTVAAIDNFDVKATSLSGNSEFHGTSISIFQHPTSSHKGVTRTFCTNYTDVKAGGERSVPELPDFYSTVPDFVLPSKRPSPPESNLVVAAKVVGEGNYYEHFKVTHVKRAREVHQVTASVLHTLLLEAYENDDPDNLDVDLWVLERGKENPTFYYWLQVLNHHILLSTFVKSIRQSNFLLYKECLHRMLPWFFLFDRQNYARWLKVHSMNLEELEEKAPELHQQFLLGKFTVNATGKKDSAVGIDHRHEQNNKELKSSGGAVGLTHHPAALRRFTVGAPKVSRLLHEFNSGNCPEEEDDELEIHHEQTTSYQTRFLDMCTALRDIFNEYENPFSVSDPNLLVIDVSRVVMEESVAQELMSAEAKGTALVKSFVEDRLVNNTKTKIFDPIKKCSFVIFGKKRRIKVHCCSKHSNLPCSFIRDFSLSALPGT